MEDSRALKSFITTCTIGTCSLQYHMGYSATTPGQKSRPPQTCHHLSQGRPSCSYVTFIAGAPVFSSYSTRPSRPYVVSKGRHRRLCLFVVI